MIEQKDLDTIFDNINKITVYDIRELICTSMVIADLFKEKILTNTNVNMTDIIDYPHIIETFILHLEKLAETNGEFELVPTPFNIFGSIKFTMKSYVDTMRLYRNKLGLKKFTEAVCGVISIIDESPINTYYKRYERIDLND